MQMFSCLGGAFTVASATDIDCVVQTAYGPITWDRRLVLRKTTAPTAPSPLAPAGGKLPHWSLGRSIARSFDRSCIVLLVRYTTPSVSWNNAARVSTTVLMMSALKGLMRKCTLSCIELSVLSELASHFTIF